MSTPIQIPTPQPVNLSENVLENWNFFKANWENYLIATGLDQKDEKIKVATLLSIIGKEAFLIYQHLDMSERDRKNAAVIIDALDKHFQPSINVIYERSVFNEAVQEGNETVEQYLCRLRKLASTCNYKGMLEELIRDRLVLGIQDQNTKKQLISDPKLTLTKAINICKSNESANKQIDRLSSKNENFEEINKMKDKFKNKKSESPKLETFAKQSRYEAKCKYCARTHEFSRNKCPAMNQICRNCGKRNHWAKVCRNKRTVQELHEENFDSNGESDNECNKIGHIFKINESKKLMTKLTLQASEYCKKVKCQMDTGATVDVMSFKDLCNLCQDPNPKLEKSKIRLRCYGGKILKPRGQVTVLCWKDSKAYPIKFQIVDTSDNPLLSANTCQELNLLEVKAEICKMTNLPIGKEPLMEKYKEIFDGLGCIQGDYRLETKPEVTPVKQPPRRVPIPLRKELKMKLDEMLRNKIICKVTHPTDWISNLVLVKTAKKLRICIDPQNLNTALKRSEYPIPMIEEIMPNLSKAKLFSVVDTKDGFWNVKLSNDCTDLTTFWTPFGRYKFLRLPFGLCTASEEYQRRLHEVFEGLEGISIIADDILIVGRGNTTKEAREDHDRNFENLLKRAKEANVKFNKNKVKLRMNEVKYLGHIFTSDGLKPDPEKIKAIREMPRPKDIQEIKSFLGFSTYLSKFMPKLSSVCEPLRKLTKKNVAWKWSKEQEQSFQTVKNLVVQAPVLGYYDPNKKVTIQCDASKAGLGATLMQEGKPITFASKSLTKTEQQYAQIEKECLAIVFACERFHQFISGKEEVKVETDHKPLEIIFKKELLKAPKRLQRMLLRLQKYNLKVTFIKGEKMYIADILSRASLPACSDENLNYNIFEIDEIYNDLENTKTKDFLNVSDDTYERLKVETANDLSLIELKKLILDGWPLEKEQTSILVRDYWTYRDELSAQDGCIFKEDRIVIPKSMRPEMISKVHQGHLGINASLRRARDTLFWPRMSSEVKDKIQNCEVCNIYQNYLQKEPMKTHKIPELPWERVSADLFENNGKYYLVLVDNFSDYFEVDELTNLTSNAVINKCKQHFSRHGIPRILLSDNGKQFRSSEFARFAKKWQFKHSTSSPYHSQGNGKAESAVKIVKNIIKKSIHDHDDIWLSILNWRNTPTVDMGSSPVQRLMSRRTKSLLPTSKKLLEPKLEEFVSQRISLKRREAKKYYDRKSKELPELDIGQEVYVRTPPTKSKETEKWTKGSVVNKQNKRSYNVIVNGNRCRRNRTWLKSQDVPKSQDVREQNSSSGEPITQESSEPVDRNSETDYTTTKMSRWGRKVITPKRYKL